MGLPRYVHYRMSSLCQYHLVAAPCMKSSAAHGFKVYYSKSVHLFFLRNEVVIFEQFLFFIKIVPAKIIPRLYHI